MSIFCKSVDVVANFTHNIVNEFSNKNGGRNDDQRTCSNRAVEAVRGLQALATGRSVTATAKTFSLPFSFSFLLTDDDDDARHSFDSLVSTGDEHIYRL